MWDVLSRPMFELDNYIRERCAGRGPVKLNDHYELLLMYMAVYSTALARSGAFSRHCMCDNGQLSS